MAEPCSFDSPCDSPAVDWARLGVRLKQVRKASGKKLDSVAEEIGLSRGAIGNWQRGDELPTTRNLEAYAKATGSELWIDFIHPREARGTFSASREAIGVARIVDSLSVDERAHVLRLISVVNDVDDVTWGMLMALVEGIEARRQAQLGARKGKTSPI